jgi:hypothetical protein
MLETHIVMSSLIFLSRSYSHVPPRFYSCASPCTFSRALPRTSSCALPQFAHGPNHRSYGFGPRDNRFVPRRFGYGPRPHHGDRFPRGLVSLLEGLTLTLSRDIWTTHVFPIVIHIPLGQMVGWKGLRRFLLIVWLSAGFLRFISLTPAWSYRPLLVLCR